MVIPVHGSGSGLLTFLFIFASLEVESAQSSDAHVRSQKVCGQTPHLATITSRDENNFIELIIYGNDNNDPVWIGASQILGSSDKDGRRWDSGETLYIYDWLGGEPTRDEDDCATSWTVEENGEVRWYGRLCNEEYGRIEGN